MTRRDRSAGSPSAVHHARFIVETISQAPDDADAVLASWRRCVESYRLNPDNFCGPEILASQELKVAAAPLEDLRHVARAEIADLLTEVGSNYIVLLTTEKGMVLDASASMVLDRSTRRFGVCEGALWEEALAGTNGIGTALTSGASVTVRREEHFYYAYADLTCTATPIRNSHGDTIAALNVSALSDLPDELGKLMRGLVARCARRIERRYFLHRHADRPILQLQRSPELTGTAGSMLLALGDDGNAVDAIGDISLASNTLRRDDVMHRPLPEIVAIKWLENSLPVTDAKFDRMGIAHSDRCGDCFATLRVPKGKSRTGRTTVAVARGSRTAGPLTLDKLAGGDSVLQEQAQAIKRLVNRGLPILLQGETGTGKEEFARAIHDVGARATGPFVAIDCSSIPESLIESELFGYETGTFTGARREGRRGRIADANGGTLFLDEIGDMPLVLQTRLLRVLGQRELIPLGASKTVRVDFNLISASHQNLPGMVAEGRFRQDLYYRIAGMRIELPPLRQRDDIADIVYLALALESAEAGIDPPGVKAAAMKILLGQTWPGNIRELRLAIRFALASATGNQIDVDDLPPWLESGEGAKRRPLSGPIAPVFSTAETLPPPDLAAVLRRHDWCVTDAASELKVSRQTLYRWMRRQSLVRPS